MAITKEEKLERGTGAREAATPPEGGWGWMIVAGCFLATICIRAVTRCVSIFFVEFQLHFERDYSTTAWIHSLIDSTTMFCAPLGGLLGNHLSCRAIVILGGLLSSLGLVLGSFATSLEHLYISLGVVTGLGFALSYTPAIAMVGRYFSERKALAYGIALSGSGIGTFILAPVVQLLIEHYSWRGALLVLGGFVSNLCVCGALMRPLEPRQRERIWENNVENQERDYMTTVLDSKYAEKVPAGFRQAEQKQLEIKDLKDTQSLLITNGVLKNLRLENNKLTQGNKLLCSSLPDPSLTNQKISECILFTNKLTETMLGESKYSDPQRENGSSTEGLKLLESMNLHNKAADANARFEDSGLKKAKLTGCNEADKTVTLPSKPLVNSKTSPRGPLCLKSKEDFGFLLSPDFLILSLSVLFMAYGCSAPLVYLVPYALSVGVESQQAAFLMSIFGVSSIVGNITFGWITDRKCLKRYRLLCYLIAIGMEGLCCVFTPLLHAYPLLVSWSVLYGYFDGAYVALIPVVASDVVGPTFLTSALGVVYFLHGIPYLVSPPIGGWLVDRTGNYQTTFFLCGVSFMLSSAVLAVAMIVKRCRRCSSGCAAAPLNVDNIVAAPAHPSVI